MDVENIEPPGSKYNPNFADAVVFLRVLGADAKSRIHWQLVPERAAASARPQSFAGSFAEVRSRLAAENAAGSAVFVGVTVMAEDAPARQAEYDCGSRVMVLDLDGAPLPAFDDGLPAPHLISETSPGRYHCIWRLATVLPTEAWQAQQRRLAARFGGDPSVGKPAQTIRVPGFIHQKAAPFRSRVVARRDGLPVQPSIFVTALADVAAASAGRGGAGRRGDAGVIVRGGNGIVIDGRETWLRDLVFYAWRDDPGATPEAIAAAAIARFRETASLHASRRYRNWDEIERAALTKARAVVKKERRRERAAAAEPWTPPPELEPAAAQEQMRALIREHIETHAPQRIDPETERVPYDPEKPKPRTAIVATAGLGKSTTFIEVLAEMVDDFGTDSPRCIWYVTATYALARELAEKARAAGLRATAIRGRTYTSGEDDPPLCKRHEVVKAITAAGVTNVRGNLCEKNKAPEEGTDGESVKVKCIHFDTCAYWAQFNDAHIYFLSHEYLFLRPTDKLSRPDYVVVDELPLNAFFVERHCAPEAITRTAHDALPIVQAAIDDMRRGVDPREGLRQAEITASALRETAAAIRKRPEHDANAAVWPHLADEVILRQLKRRAVPWAARFLDAFATEFQFRRDRLAGVRYRRRVADDDANTAEWFEFQHPSTMMLKHSVPMLLLDGTANKILVQEFFADHDTHQGNDEMTPEELAWRRGVGFVEIHARRSARVTQITNFSGAKRRLLSPVDTGRPETYADKYLPVIFSRLPKNDSILFVTYKKVEEYITEAPYAPTSGAISIL